MADSVTRDKLDQDLETERSTTADYIAACDAYFSNQQVIDFAAEDQTVNDLMAAVTAARGRVPGGPPPPPKPGP